MKDHYIRNEKRWVGVIYDSLAKRYLFLQGRNGQVENRRTSYSRKYMPTHKAAKEHAEYLLNNP